MRRIRHFENFMKANIIVPTLVAAVLLGGAAALTAQPAEAPSKPTREDLREQFRNLTPEERRAKLQEYRDRQTPAQQETLNRRLQDLRHMTPEQREERFREFRAHQSGITNAPSLQSVTSEERMARMKARMEELRASETAGTISAEEKIQLQRMEQVIRRFETQPEKREATPRQEKQTETKTP
jgi:hypothetical protein